MLSMWGDRTFDKWTIAIGLVGMTIFGLLYYYGIVSLSGATGLLFGLCLLTLAVVFVLSLLSRGRSYI